MSDAINHSDTTCADAPDQQVRQQSILKNVVEHIHALVFSIDREYRYTCFNSSHAAMMKALYGAEIAVGGNLFSYMTVPDDARAARANLERTFQGEVLREEAFSGELTLSRRFFEITHRPLRCPAGEIIGAVMTATDITERRAMEQALRESEATLRAITDSTQAAILMMDQTGRVSFWNRAAEEILGWTAEEAIGQPVHTLICPERFHARHLAAYPAFLAGGAGATAGRTVEVRARRKDGGEIPVELSLSGVELESGWHAVGILLDITERNQIQTQLLAAQKMESIGQLAAGIAHEINTPTQFIGDNLSFLSNAFVSLRRVVEKYAEMEPVLAKHAPEQALAVAETRRQADLEYVLQEGALALTQATDGVQRVARIVRAMKDFSHPGTKEKCAVDLNAAILTTLTVARNAWKNVADIATDLAPVLHHQGGRPRNRSGTRHRPEGDRDRAWGDDHVPERAGARHDIRRAPPAGAPVDDDEQRGARLPGQCHRDRADFLETAQPPIPRPPGRRSTTGTSSRSPACAPAAAAGRERAAAHRGTRGAGDFINYLSTWPCVFPAAVAGRVELSPPAVAS